MKSSENWSAWAESKWRSAESGWVERGGQDHFYRQSVVLPSLLGEILSGSSVPASILEVGCGDGCTVSLLVAGLMERGIGPSLAFLDRSEGLLESARRDPSIGSARFVQSDLGDSGWHREVGDLQRPALILAIFVLQEMPQLGTVFRGLSKLMTPGDRFIAVVPAPRFAEQLREAGRLRLAQEGRRNDDWEWVGEYPIPTEKGTLALPHFQRSIGGFERAAIADGLALVGHRYLQVPGTSEARAIFRGTDYGEEIVGANSSLLLIFSR